MSLNVNAENSNFNKIMTQFQFIKTFFINISFNKVDKHEPEIRAKNIQLVMVLNESCWKVF